MIDRFDPDTPVDTSAIDWVAEQLKEADIPFSLFDGMSGKVLHALRKNGTTYQSIAQHAFSYGARQGLLELMPDVDGKPNNVTGWVTK